MSFTGDAKKASRDGLIVSRAVPEGDEDRRRSRDAFLGCSDCLGCSNCEAGFVVSSLPKGTAVTGLLSCRSRWAAGLRYRLSRRRYPDNEPDLHFIPLFRALLCGSDASNLRA